MFLAKGQMWQLVNVSFNYVILFLAAIAPFSDLPTHLLISAFGKHSKLVFLRIECTNSRGIVSLGVYVRSLSDLCAEVFPVLVSCYYFSFALGLRSSS